MAAAFLPTADVTSVMIFELKMIVGIGVDVVEIARARRLLRAYGDRLLARVCTAAEAAYVRSHVDGAQHLAVSLDDLTADGVNPHGRYLYFAPDEVEPIGADA